MRNVLLLFLVSILYVGSVFWVSQGKTFRLDSDYDSNLPIIAYVVDTIRNEHRFPFWDPLVGTGISVLGDPLSAVTYLPYFLPSFLFGVPEGLWVVVWLHAFLAGLFMWMFLRTMKIGDPLAVWGGLLYMGAGAFAARVAAGHVEKVLSYPWYPLFLMVLFRSQSARLGAIMGIVFLTGDMYGLLFMMIFYGVVWVVSGIKGIGGVVAGFAIVAAVKLVPFLREVAPVMERFSAFNPQQGSMPAWLAWLPFVMPAGVAFYDRPILQRLVGFWYNWYEYYAFIGLPVIFLLWVPAVVKRREVQLLLLLLAVGIVYVARGQVYSPFFGLSPILTPFRVPQRMFAALTSIVVALIVLSATGRKKPTWWVLWGMLLVTFVVSGYQMTHAFRAPRACCTQLHLIREKIRVINYYYGWIAKPIWENQSSP